MKIRILGSGQEVGKSAILLKGNKNIVLDYGVKLHGESPEYPIADEKIHAGIISHAHLDHSGASPLLHKWGAKVFMNKPTLDLTEMLLYDSIKIAGFDGFNIPFNKKDVNGLVKNTHLVNYNKNFRVGDYNCSLYDSGHIPGSASIFVKGKKSVFYTADIQTDSMNLVHSSKFPSKCDVLITESTYSYKDHHPDRKKEEKRLFDEVSDALAKNEKVLLPVLAVGRSQEIMLILAQYAKFIAIDGMVKKSSEIISKHPNFIKSPEKLKKVLNKIKWVKNRHDRETVFDKRPIIISSSGMLGGGPSVGYLRQIRRRSDSKVLLSCYQPKDSPGYELMDGGKYLSDEEEFTVKCIIDKFELSSHADKSGIFDIIRKTNPETVVCVHGENCKDFVKEIEQEFPNVQAIAPKNGEEIDV